MDLIRREIKFQIPLRLVGPMSEYLAKYCDLDPYSACTPGEYYTINSLYLDSKNMQLLENKRNNLPRRFSMRIRSYSDQPKFPAFMEIKARSDQFIQKRRSRISSWDTIEFIRDGGAANHKDLEHPFMKKACYEIMRLKLMPKMMTQYKRKAFVGRYEPYSRVTFDRCMRCYPESSFNIFPSERKFLNYDHNEQYLSDQSSVVLELKTERRVPLWMLNMISYFELRQSQFSKYDSSWTFLTDKTDLLGTSKYDQLFMLSSVE